MLPRYNGEGPPPQEVQFRSEPITGSRILEIRREETPTNRQEK